MSLTRFDQFVANIAAGYWASQPIYGDQQSSTSALLSGLSCYRVGVTKTLPSPLPTGVLSYIPTRISINMTGLTAAQPLIAKVVNLGSIDISGASGTFTDGSAMPTITECGVSRITSGIVIAEVTTALSATPGSLTITYKDQDNNTAETTTAQSLTGSAPVGDCGFIVLNTGDTGVTDITAATRSSGSSPTGVIRFWGIIPLAMINIPTASAGAGNMDNLLTGSFNPYRLGAGDTIKQFSINTSAHSVMGDIFFVGET